MEQFRFSAEQQSTSQPLFHGPTFYNVYKSATFLKSPENIENILTRGHEIRQKLREVPAGTVIAIEGMMLTKNLPLLVKKSGPGIIVKKHEFTYNRLCGFVAAYVYENRDKYPGIKCPESLSLGLEWDCKSKDKCKLYLSAVSGTEHFCNAFSFWPLVCALRKFALKKLPENLLIKIAKVKCDDGEIMAQELRDNMIVTTRIWQMFSGSSPDDLRKILFVQSPELKKLVSAVRK